jgi:hypothetical protein
VVQGDGQQFTRVVSDWAVYALLVVGGPLLLVTQWLVTDSLHRRKQLEDCSARAIIDRVQQERSR